MNESDFGLGYVLVLMVLLLCLWWAAKPRKHDNDSIKDLFKRK